MKKYLKTLLSLVLAFAMAFSVQMVAENKQVKADSLNYVIKVNLGTNCTTIYEKKSGKPVTSFICSPSSETPVGTFYIPVKYRWHEMIGNCYAQYCSRITTGVLFHSVWYYKYGDKSSMSVGAYNVMGQKASHGCVRLLCKDAKWIYDNCAVGTKIVIFWGNKKDDPLGRPGFTPITTGARTGWDPTDPDPANPYKKASPVIWAKTAQIEYGSSANVLNYVNIKDGMGGNLTNNNGKITIKGKINTKKLGSYKVDITATNIYGKSAVRHYTFRVVDTKPPILSGAVSKARQPLFTTVDFAKLVTCRTAAGQACARYLEVCVKFNNKVIAKTKGKCTPVKFEKTGMYYIDYKLTGYNGKVTKKSIKYSVQDQRVKQEWNENTINIEYGGTYDVLSHVKSLKTFDGKDLDVSKNCKVVGEANTTKPGRYYLTLVSQDGSKTYTKTERKFLVIVGEKPEDPTEPPTTAPVVEPITSLQ